MHNIIVVKIQKDDVVDQYGVSWSPDIPSHVIRKMKKQNKAARRHITKNGNIQWRLINVEEFESFVEHEPNHDIREFIRTCYEKKPHELIMPDVRWKYMVRSILRGKNVLLTGPSGTGKTMAAKCAIKLFSNRQNFYFNLGATQDAKSTLIGNTHFTKEDGTFHVPSMFIRAIQTPNAIVHLDEISRAHPDAHNIMMTVLDPTVRTIRIDEDPDTPEIKVADGVSFIGTANIGAEYTATRVLDRALIDRFMIVEMEPLQLADEMKLLKKSYPNVDQWSLRAIAEIAEETRVQVRSDDPTVSTIISSRMTLEMAGLLDDGFTLGEAAEVCVYPFYSDAGGASSERVYMKQLVQKYLRDDQSPDRLYELDDALDHLIKDKDHANGPNLPY